MKKLLSFILFAFYFISTSGASLHLHYCMGKMADWSFGNAQTEVCSFCGMDNTESIASGCCSDQETFLKNGHDQKTVNHIIDLQLNIDPLPLQTDYQPPAILGVILDSPIPANHAPPRCSGIPLIILNQSFLI